VACKRNFYEGKVSEKGKNVQSRVVEEEEKEKKREVLKGEKKEKNPKQSRRLKTRPRSKGGSGTKKSPLQPL